MDDKEKKQFDLSLSDEGIQKTPRQEQPKKNEYSVWFYLGTFGNIGLSIALPIVLGVLAGAFVDGKQNTRPMFTLVGLVLGLIISIAGFIQMIRKIMKGEYNPKK